MALRTKNPVFALPMRVWDAATRIFHWSLPLLLATSYISISLADGPNAALWMKIHFISGEIMLAALLFRIVWGLIGSETSRFAQFLRSPMAAIKHLSHIGKIEPDLEVGHNAAGGWMALGLLLLLAIQVGTGLGSNDDGSTEGPLVQFIGKPASDVLSTLHGMNFNILIAAIVLHLGAIIVYAVVKKQNLVRPMITGKKRLPGTTRAPRMANPWLAFVTLAVAVGVTVVISRL